MQIRNNALAKQLMLGDTAVLGTDELRVYKVEQQQHNQVLVEFFGQIDSRVLPEDTPCEVVIDLKVGQRYFVGDRDQDFEWLVCEYLHRAEERQAVWMRSPHGPADDAVLEPYDRIIGVATDEAIKALYLKYRGTRCPFCRSDDISNGDSNTDDNWHAISVTCDTCGATWDDVYVLSSLEKIEQPDAFK
jgi:hypothetical protein